MVRDAEARGSGPLRRGNPVPPEDPEIVAQVPTFPQRTPPTDVSSAANPATPPASSGTPAVPASPDTLNRATSTAPPTGSRRATAARPADQSTPTAQVGSAIRPAPAPTSDPAGQKQAGSLSASAPRLLPAENAAPLTSAVSAPRPSAGAPAVPPVPSTPAPARAAQPSAATQPSAAAPATPRSVSAEQPLSSSSPSGHTVASSRRHQREQGNERPSFLQQEHREEPARRGARGVLNRVGFSLGPSAQEQAAREDERAVSQHWPGPRTVAVVNGKGGAGKTPTTALLSAVFAQYGGAGVLAWDNNQTRGTLGWRTETGAHDRTLLELLPETERLLGARGQSADLAQFVHHQPQEKYDVLRSKPIRLAHENRLRPADVDAIHSIAAKFYRLIIIDSGNDESDPMWLRMIDLADQIVVATTTRDDHAEAGALLLEALEDRDERSARLARQSVVVVTQADSKASPADVAHVVNGYQPLAREVVHIPFDHEMVDGHLRLRALGTPAQEAWLAAAAAVARGF